MDEYFFENGSDKTVNLYERTSLKEEGSGTETPYVLRFIGQSKTPVEQPTTTKSIETTIRRILERCYPYSGVARPFRATLIGEASLLRKDVKEVEGYWGPGRKIRENGLNPSGA